MWVINKYYAIFYMGLNKHLLIEVGMGLGVSHLQILRDDHNSYPLVIALKDSVVKENHAILILTSFSLIMALP